MFCQEVLHHNLVRRRHSGVLKHHAQAGLAPHGLRVPDFDQRVGSPGDSVVLSSARHRHAVERAELIELLGFDHVADQFGRDQLGDTRLRRRQLQAHRLAVVRGDGLTLPLDHAKRLVLDELRVPGAERRILDQQLGELARVADDLVREGAHLAMKFLHPVARRRFSVAEAVTPDVRADVGDRQLDIGLGPILRPQHVIVGRLAPDKPLGRSLRREPRHSDRAIGWPSPKRDFARGGVGRAPAVPGLDLPAQVSSSDHRPIGLSRPGSREPGGSRGQ